MIALAALLVTQSGWLVSDFFPLAEGTKWHYLSQVGNMSAVQIDEAKSPISIDGKTATPIETQVDGRIVGTSYYRCQGDTLFLVAENPKKPLSVPQPILKVGEGKVKWNFTGETMFMGTSAVTETSSESVLKRDRPALDRKFDTVEARTTSKIGSGALTALQGKQTTYYAKGIGLVEMVSEQVVAKSRTKATLKLIKFEAPK